MLKIFNNFHNQTNDKARIFQNWKIIIESNTKMYHNGFYFANSVKETKNVLNQACVTDQTKTSKQQQQQQK